MSDTPGKKSKAVKPLPVPEGCVEVFQVQTIFRKNLVYDLVGTYLDKAQAEEVCDQQNKTLEEEYNRKVSKWTKPRPWSPVFEVKRRAALKVGNRYHLVNLTPTRVQIRSPEQDEANKNEEASSDNTAYRVAEGRP